MSHGPGLRDRGGLATSQDSSVHGLRDDVATGLGNVRDSSLSQRISYPMVLAVMVTVAVGMLPYFHRRSWLG